MGIGEARGRNDAESYLRRLFHFPAGERAGESAKPDSGIESPEVARRCRPPRATGRQPSMSPPRRETWRPRPCVQPSRPVADEVRGQEPRASPLTLGETTKCHTPGAFSVAIRPAYCSAAPARWLAGAAEAGELIGDRAPLGIRELSPGVAIGDRPQHAFARAGGVEDSTDMLIEAGWFLDVGDRLPSPFGGASFL